MIEPLAYFRCDEDAEQFEGIMDLILQIFNGERKGGGRNNVQFSFISRIT